MFLNWFGRTAESNLWPIAIGAERPIVIPGIYIFRIRNSIRIIQLNNELANSRGIQCYFPSSKNVAYKRPQDTKIRKNKKNRNQKITQNQEMQDQSFFENSSPYSTLKEMLYMQFGVKSAFLDVIASVGETGMARSEQQGRWTYDSRFTFVVVNVGISKPHESWVQQQQQSELSLSLIHI